MLNANQLNALSQPLLARLLGSKNQFEILNIEAQSRLTQINVCGRQDCIEFGDIAEIIDAEGKAHDPDGFWLEQA